MPNDPDYLPDTVELYARAEALRWMTNQGWDDDFIVSVMIYDNPSIDTVRRLVYRHGPELAYRRMMRVFIW